MLSRVRPAPGRGNVRSLRSLLQSSASMIPRYSTRTFGICAEGRCTLMNGCTPTGSSPAARQVPFYLRPYGNALPELLGKRNDDALRAADVTEPIHVLILGDFTYVLSAIGAQAREDVLNVVDGEHDATYAQRIHWCVLRLSSDRRRRVELVQLKPTVAVRGPHHRYLASNVLEPNDTVHPTPRDGHLALQLHTKFDKECLRSLKVLDHDENVVHSFKRHALPPKLGSGVAGQWSWSSAHARGADPGCNVWGSANR